jgi:hypothetical protein
MQTHTNEEVSFNFHLPSSYILKFVELFFSSKENWMSWKFQELGALHP